MSKQQDRPAWRQFDRKGRKRSGLERFVAAIHKLEAGGAEIHWGEKINGREFDVTVRVRDGEQVRLTVIECRDLSKRVSVEAVEAFITKAADANAAHAIMVSGITFINPAAQQGKLRRREGRVPDGLQHGGCLDRIQPSVEPNHC